MKNFSYIIVFSTAFHLLVPAQGLVKYPVTEKQTQTDDYFGTKVEDPYRWLEDDRSANTAEWVKRENSFTEDYLKMMPARARLKARLTELWNFNKQTAPYKKGDLFFCSRNNGLQNQSVLFVMNTLSDVGEVLLDPNTLSSDGTVSLNSTSISKDAKTLAYGISRAGSDWVEIHFRDIASKQDLPDVLKWVKFSGASWVGNSVYYSRYDEPQGSELSQSNKNHKVYLHHLGAEQQKDELVFEDKDHPNYNFGAWVSDDQRFLFLSTSESTSGEKLMVKDLTDPAGKFVSISDNFNNDYNIIDNDGPRIYVLTNKDAPKYKLVTIDVVNSEIKNWNTLIPESAHLLEGVRICNFKIIANYLQDVSSHLYLYEMSGKRLKEIPLQGICRLSAFNTDKNYDFATYSISQFTSPEQTYYLDGKTFESKLLFSPNCKFDSKNYITEQVFFPSKDGSMIPMFITHRKGLQLTPQTPCFVYGYGGFNISIAPEFRIDRAVFLEAGGIYCVPTLRGGGEYGEEWHKAGTKCNKQTVFDDFIAACEFLVSKKYTSYTKIAIHGRSNGGLLIGAVMTQRPDICKVAIPAVGVLDMLRFHLFTIGRAWTVDYGCSDNKTEFECLYKYSPLHNIKSVAYPATLILTGDHDDRVVPAHSFKFAATLQEKNTGPNPCLIRIDVNAGHGAGKPTSKQIDEFADLWAFTFKNLGIK
ncbi:MAG: prolyl oligopeptidase family serine peptidase [bacterium]|nr:prolyl oligopeptidase family serine peptidase [bacterium]